MNFEQSLKKVSIAEGKWTNNKYDSGGITACGIARNANPDWGGWKIIDRYFERGLSLQQTEKICRADAQFMALVNALYRGKYWNTAQCPYVPELLKYPMFSCAVNCGHKIAIILLQRAAGVKDDGIFGKITRTTCNSLPQRELCERFYTKWENYYKAIVKNKPSQQVFLKGWLNRIANVRKDNY